MPYINIYDLTRTFSGPEEGGTYHNEWELIASHRIRGKTDSDKARQMLNRFRVRYGFTPSTSKRYKTWKTFRALDNYRREMAFADGSELGQIDRKEIRLESTRGQSGNSWQPYS